MIHRKIQTVHIAALVLLGSITFDEGRICQEIFRTALLVGFFFETTVQVTSVDLGFFAKIFAEVQT